MSIDITTTILSLAARFVGDRNDSNASPEPVLAPMRDDLTVTLLQALQNNEPQSRHDLERVLHDDPHRVAELPIWLAKGTRFGYLDRETDSDVTRWKLSEQGGEVLAEMAAHQPLPRP